MKENQNYIFRLALSCVGSSISAIAELPEMCEVAPATLRTVPVVMAIDKLQQGQFDLLEAIGYPHVDEMRREWEQVYNSLHVDALAQREAAAKEAEEPVLTPAQVEVIEAMRAAGFEVKVARGKLPNG